MLEPLTSPSAPGAVRRTRGLTVLEMMIVFAVLAVLTASAVPSFAAMLARHRLVAAAQELAVQLAEARFEAARLGRPVHFAMRGRPEDWCYAVAASPDPDCRGRPAGALHIVGVADHPGVTLLEAGPLAFDARDGRPAAPATLQWRSSRGDRLDVRVNAFGRASVCSPDGSVASQPRC